MISAHLFIVAFVVFGLLLALAKAPEAVGTAIGVLFVILFWPVFVGKLLGGKLERALFPGKHRA